MIKTVLTRGLLVLACGTTAFTVNTMAAHAGTPVNWQQRTCSALTAWQHNPATARLDTLVRDSLHLQRGYLASDVAQLLAVSVGAKQDQHGVDVADQYAEQDCYGGA